METPVRAGPADGRPRVGGYRRIHMADPAAASPPRRTRSRWARRRPGRLAGILLAGTVGVVAVAIGVARTATDVAGNDPNRRSATNPSLVASGIPASSPTAGASIPEGSPAPSRSGPSPSPSSGPSPAAGGSVALRERLQAELDRLRIRLAMPGVSATVILPNGTSWTGVSGLADVAGRVPVTAETAFAYASVSKTFTSALILELIDEGRLRLTDPAVALLPPLR